MQTGSGLVIEQWLSPRLYHEKKDHFLNRSNFLQFKFELIIFLDHIEPVKYFLGFHVEAEKSVKSFSAEKSL